MKRQENIRMKKEAKKSLAVFLFLLVSRPEIVKTFLFLEEK